MGNTDNLILNEVRALATAVKGISRQLERVDQRLDNVEGVVIGIKKQTDLIPGIAEAVTAHSLETAA